MQLGFISKKGDNTTETGWDPLLKGLYLTNRLGQFVPGLVSDKCLPNQKIPTETKNNLYTCAVGADYGQRDKKRPQTPISEELGANGAYMHGPCTQHH